MSDLGELTEIELEGLWRESCSVWKPPPSLTVSQWAEKYGKLIEGTAYKGNWTNIGFQVAIMDAFSNPMIWKVVCKKSARVGWTKMLGHVISYYSHLDPCSQLMVQPREKDAEDWSKEDFQSIVTATDVLHDIFPTAKSRDSANTILKKHYNGGILHIVGANSPAGLRRISVRNAYFDECNGYPETAGVEGDQIALGTERTDDYPDRTIGIGSTPTIEGFSRISDELDESSPGRFFLNCPHCDGEHIRLWRIPEKTIRIRGEDVPVSPLQWLDGRPSTAKWMCPHCAELISYKYHRRMVNNGFWKGEHWDWTKQNGYTFLDGFEGVIGFQVWAGYSFSPNRTPQKMVERWLREKSSPKKLKVIVNTVFGEDWEEAGEVIDMESLSKRAQQQTPYDAQVPTGVMYITVGIDVQGDRIEFEVVGWGIGEESWSIEYQVLYGEPLENDVWDELFAFLTGKYTRADGSEVSIDQAFIDASHLTDQVYAQVRRSKLAFLIAIMGKDGERRPVIENRSKRALRLRKRQNKKKMAPEIVGSDEAKIVRFAYLKKSGYGPGCCHFPIGYDDEYYEQMTAEKMITRYRKDVPVMGFKKTRARNEAGDNRDYAYAALRYLNPDWKKAAPKPPPRAVESRRPQRRSQSRNDNFRNRRGWVKRT